MKILEIPKPEIVGRFDAEAAQAIAEEHFKSLIAPCEGFDTYAERFDAIASAIGVPSVAENELRGYDEYTQFFLDRFFVISDNRWHIDDASKMVDVEIGSSCESSLTRIVYGSLLIDYQDSMIKGTTLNDYIEIGAIGIEDQIKNGNIQELKYSPGDIVRLVPGTPHKREVAKDDVRLFFRRYRIMPHVSALLLKEPNTEFLDQYGYKT